MRVEPHRGAILRRDARAADAVESGARIGHFDEARKADAAMNAAFASLGLIAAKPVIVHHGHELLERGLMRERFELDAGRCVARVGVVGDQVQPPDLGGIHADPGGCQIDEAFGHGDGDRMADGAILAHDVLVLEHHPRPGTVVAGLVGAADEVHHLVGLDAAGARIHRERPDAGEVVDLEGGDGPVVLHGDARLDAMVAGMDVGGEALQPVGDELDRPFQQLGEGGGRHLVGIDVDLDAERSADILGDDAHLMLGEIQMLGEDVLHHVGRLRPLIDGQPLLAGIEVGEDRARLERHAGVAAEDENLLDDLVRFLESPVHLADIEDTLESEVVAELGMDDRRFRVERRLRIGDDRELLIVDDEQFGGVFGKRPRLGDDRRHGLALPAGAVDGDCVLRRRFQPLQMRQDADPRRADFRDLRPRDDGDDARRGPCRLAIDAGDPRVGMRRADEDDMPHARQDEVADILSATLQKPLEIGARNGAANIGVRAVERRKAGTGRRLAHASAPASLRAAV